MTTIETRNSRSNGTMYLMEYPDSVEEAAALLGATITRCCGVNGRNVHEAILPPLGMHPAFAVVVNNNNSNSSNSGGTPESELLHRLYILRSMLRTASDKNEPLVAAPSILQVLKKILSITTQVAAAATTSVSASIPTTITVTNSNTTPDSRKVTGAGDATKEQQQRRTIVLHHKYDTPPLWSTPCRILWVDCVVLCFALSAANNSNDVTLFVRQMLALASIHPRSVKAGGGVRIAALAVIAALLEHDDVVSPDHALKSAPRNFTLATKLAPWSLDILQVCLKALRSAGNGEPTFREAAIRAACATAIACRNAAMKNRDSRGDGNSSSTTGPENFCLSGAMEDKAIVESIKILKQAVTDKFPEIRSGAATFAITLAPILIPHSTGGVVADSLLYLEDVMQLALRNLDDESLAVADGWAEAMARCLCTGIQNGDMTKAATQSTSRSIGSGEGGDDGADSSASGATTPSPSASASRFGSKKLSGLARTLNTSVKVVNYLVEQFVKAGGELTASKAGGTYSIGGRAVRLGWSMILARFLRVQSAVSAIGESRSISMHKAIVTVLEMVRMEVDEQANVTPARSSSVTDVALCRLFTLRVLRYGLTELASESIQLGILQELVSLLPIAETAESSQTNPYPLKENQIHVVLMEISNLILALGEAAGSRIDELKVAIDVCLASNNSGIRHETASLCVTIASQFPTYGITLINDSLEIVQQQLTQIVEAIPAGQGNSKEDKKPTQFRRAAPKLTNGKSVSNLSNESSILGRALLVSMLTKAMPNQLCGFPRSILASVLQVAEILISSQFNELLTTSSPSTVCSLVRAGFIVLCGVLTAGPDAVEVHMSEILNAWKKAGKAAKEGGKSMSLVQDLSGVESALTSVTVFLKYCSELLLIIPEALSQVSMFLEEIFPLLQTNGRLVNIGIDPHAKILLENATATLLEAFAWLPSGSFPLVADEIFSFAEEQIQKSVQGGITCSILDSLVTKQDSILDSKPYCRVGKEGKFGGARDFEETSSLVASDISLYSERESVFHLQSDLAMLTIVESDTPFCGSAVLECFANDAETSHKPPTPLHEVGTWRRPVDPSCSSRVRLIDAAIQAFSATFGLKDGKEQQGAMNLLETLLPQSLGQFARALGINAVPTEPEKRSKLKDDGAAAINVTAVLLSCLQALPLHEATHNIPIGLGPPWMNKAKVLLLTLLPSASTNVRRASAEGLALLATLGVTEDAHFLQSALLHSLDEIMQSNKPDGKARAIPVDQLSAARAGSLLTLACIQRTSNSVARRKLARARGRLYGNSVDQSIDKSNDNLPVLQMMTRILPSAACHGFKENFIVKTYALNAFTVLLMYSTRLSSSLLGEDDKQLLRKGIELVEDNFSASWTAASSDTDRCQEAERLDCEIAFIAVLLRLMTFLLPFLHHVCSEDGDVARRFSVFTTLALENFGSYPFVFIDAMAFFEVCCTNQNLLPKPSQKVRYTENAMVSCLPSIAAAIVPTRPDVFGRITHQAEHVTSFRNNLKAAAFLLKLLPLTDESGCLWTPMTVASILAATFEVVCGSRRNEHVFQSVATSRQMKYTLDDDTSLEREIFDSFIDILLGGTIINERSPKHLLRCILFGRQLLTRFPIGAGIDSKRSDTRGQVVTEAISQAVSDSFHVYNVTNTARWQLKCMCTQLASNALQQLHEAEQISCNDGIKSSQFDLLTAQNVISDNGKHDKDTNNGLPSSRIVFHLEDILSSACMSAVATVDQAELRCLQVNSMDFVKSLVECFGSVLDPEEPSKSILHQYSSQVLSSVKNAVATPGKNESKALSSLFIAGCEVLQSIVKTRLITDEIVVKRLLSMIVLPDDSLPLFSFADRFRVENSILAVEVRSMGLVTIGNLLIGRRMNLEMEMTDNLSKELVKDKLGVAVYLAAAAVDGCRILLSQDISLAGVSLDEMAPPQTFHNGGFFYENIDDLDELTKSVLTRTWTQGACSSLEVFLGQYITEESDNTRRELCTTWIHALVPLLLSGVDSGINSLVNELKHNTKVLWTMNIDPVLILNDSMYCVGRILSSEQSGALLGSFVDDVDTIINLTFESILLPIFSDVELMYSIDLSVTTEACNLMKSYAMSDVFVPERNPTFLMSLLTTLKMSERCILGPNKEYADEVIVMSFLALSELIHRLQATAALVKSVLHDSVMALISQRFKGKENVLDAAKVVVKACMLNTSSVTHDDKEKILCQLASNDLWEEWAMIVGLDTNIYPSLSSLQILHRLLRNPNQSKSHVTALIGIRLLLQSTITTSPNFFGRFVGDVGADIVHLLYTYGTMKVQSMNTTNDVIVYRTTICADAMKIILLVYRHLSTAKMDDDDDDAVVVEEDGNIVTFVSVLFDVFLAVIRFNGLPNHPSSERLYGDPGLGRICAQAILFVARTTPIPFKLCVAALSPNNDTNDNNNNNNERTLLEFAVRAEMNGYVVTAPTIEPIKKKLNLKSFQK